MKGEAAVIYFVYNRIEHTKKSFENILKYRGGLNLFIFCDGPKRTTDDYPVAQVRDYILDRAKEEFNVEIKYKNENFGLANSVIDGVTSVFKLGFSQVIVLEDDCVPERDFFLYMTKALSYYKPYDNIMHISGFGLPFKTKIAKDSIIAPYPSSWGWGTWDNKWATCDFNDKVFYKKILTDPNIKKMFDWSGKSFSKFLELQLNNNINSWLIRWYAHIFKQKGLCVWSSNSKIQNIGFDGSGEHKVRFDRFNQPQNIDGTKTENSFCFENNLLINLTLIKEFRRHFMGKKLTEKAKTILYLYTGIILDNFEDYSDYYKDL